MTEEEKKALEYFKALNKLTFEPYLSILLKLVNKQQKEIKELEVCLQAEEKYAEGLNNDIKSLLNIEPNNNFISKDKIREKIKDITEYYEKEVKPEMYHWGDFTAEEHYADIIARYNELLEE